MATKDPANWLAAQRRERGWQRLLAHLRDAPGHLTPQSGGPCSTTMRYPPTLLRSSTPSSATPIEQPMATSLPWSAPATARTRSSRRSSWPPAERLTGGSRRPVAPWPRRDMRLRILNRGHDLPTRLTFAVVRRMARACGWPAPVHPGETCRPTTALGRPSPAASTAGAAMGSWSGCWPRSTAAPTPVGSWTGWSTTWTAAWSAPTSTPPAPAMPLRWGM
jgi:hypothetical protein